MQPCPHCKRHIKVVENSCPFCGGDVAGVLSAEEVKLAIMMPHYGGPPAQPSGVGPVVAVVLGLMVVALIGVAAMLFL